MISKNEFDQVARYQAHIALLAAFKAFCDKKEFQQGIDFFTKALEENPQDSFIWSRRGELYRLRRMFPEAISDFNKALELNAQCFNSLTSLGVIYERYLNDTQKAFDCQNKSIMINPNNIDPLEARGRLYYNNKQKDKARDDFNLAIAKGSKNAEVFFLRGMISVEAAKREDAFHDFDKVITLHPTHGAAWALRAACSSPTRHKEAVSDLLHALELIPEQKQTETQKVILHSVANEVISVINSALKEAKSSGDALKLFELKLVVAKSRVGDKESIPRLEIIRDSLSGCVTKVQKNTSVSKKRSHDEFDSEFDKAAEVLVQIKYSKSDKVTFFSLENLATQAEMVRVRASLTK